MPETEEKSTSMPETEPAVLLALRAQDSVRKLEENLRGFKLAQQNRVDELEEQIQSCEARLQNRIAVLEARLQQPRQQAEESAECSDTFQQAWKSATLTLRLRFVRELLPEEHALQSVLKEAAALEELRRRGRDLETWLNTYPSLFADAAQTLESEVKPAADHQAVSSHPADLLADQTLSEARSALESTLQALGITWVTPAPGDIVTGEHEVVGDEPSPLADGRIARVRRRGFRVQGRLALPAQVMRAARPDPSAAVQAPVIPEPPDSASVEQEADTSASIDNSGSVAKESASLTDEAPADLPDWLRILRQRTFGCDLPAVSSLTEHVTALNRLPGQISAETADDAARKLIGDGLYPLIPLLGLRYADGLPDIPEIWGAAFIEVRDPLLAWLNEKMHVQILAPSRGARFDPLTMEAIETRRTVHANEHDTVAKVERIGLVWRGRPIMRAQVVQYAAEGNS